MSVRYQLLKKGVRDLREQVDVKPDSSSSAWLEYLAWAAAGNVPIPPDIPPIIVPTQADRLAQLRNDANAHITGVYPVWYQNNCANGIYPPAVADKLKSDIAAVITESNRCEDLIVAGNPYMPNWPTIGV